MIRSIVFGFLLLTLAQSVPADDVRTPKVLVEGWKIELIDSEPNLVTPVSCRFDSKGNLFVVECHTHMPPENYAGPKVDRVYVYPNVYNNRDKDVAVNARVLLYEGSVKTMGLAIDEKDWVYIASRSEVIRVKDTNYDFKADVIEKLISHQTKADYPHNGLSGLALSSDGYLYFGQGENFGEKFTIVGTDGSKQQGSGEGGSVYRCRPDGSRVERIATGIWNPFGLAFDREKRLWCVDNDPDSRPPCRLLQIVPTADYGFQFRFGRAGTNPLLSWDGELPGTIPMSAGTGEAPCEVVEHLGHLVVSSWGDNRIERFTLTPNGASLKGQMDVIVQGDADFRPVSFAVAPDQSIFFTDWVDRSYPVHGKGRLWRLTPRTYGMGPAIPDVSVEEKLARKITDGKADAIELQKAVNTDDPFLQTAATIGKTLLSSSLTAKPWNGTSAIERSENLRIFRWRSLTQSEADREINRASYVAEIEKCLKDEDLRVRLLAIRYAAESGEKSLVPELEKLISNRALDANEFHHLVSAISFLKTGSASGAKRDPARDQMLSSFFFDPTKPIELRKLALRQLPSNSKELDPSKLVEMLRDPQAKELRHDLLMYLAQHGAANVATALEETLRSPESDSGFRADLLAILASLPSFQTSWNEKIARELRSVDASKEYQMELQRVKEMLNGMKLIKARTPDPSRPKREEIGEWSARVVGKGDANQGWRVWARSQCVKCHAMDGRGAELGPDLTTLGKSADRKRILQSMLDPSREVAPLFATWNILTVDGRVLTGAKLNAGGVGTNLQFLGADGKTFEVPLKEIESQQVSFKSIMPEDITDTLSVDEISDLLEFLSRIKR